MNCHECEKAIPHGEAILVWEPDEMTKRFCTLDCIREWLGPDRPLSKRLEKGQTGKLTPQDVVVGAPQKYTSRVASPLYLWKRQQKRWFRS